MEVPLPVIYITKVKSMDNESDDKKTAEELPTELTSEDRIEAKIDRDLRDSFPASDPSGWTSGIERPDGDKIGGDAADPSSE
jgi:hypothetical protein